MTYESLQNVVYSLEDEKVTTDFSRKQLTHLHLLHFRIVDPSMDLNSYSLGNVDWKKRVEGWKLQQEKIMIQMTNKYSEGKGDFEGTGSNREEL
ncbi:hypothetical protein K2173_007249 [Erythroxylum novogranatense]|uniref:Uncharacterized protein n=1 Tax=Erythroxylum novogranatense TaxID=1862640 RepID=A0AAV8U9V1_9ROSI|nr:hypothetical protein K2173_007249 [Erythroxylum novogranatense]